MPAQDDAISEPRLLFPHNPLSPRKPDFDFEEEFEAAQAVGFEVGVVNTDDLTVTRNVSSGPVLYRGWMLRTDRYAELYRTLALQGLEMLTCPQAYRQSHHLPAWYDQLKEFTPCSCWFPKATGWSAAAVESLIGPGPWIVKDYVKSAKHYWNEACYIPQSANLQQVTRKFLEIRDDDLEGGLEAQPESHLTSEGTSAESHKGWASRRSMNGVCPETRVSGLPPSLPKVSSPAGDWSTFSQRTAVDARVPSFLLGNTATGAVEVLGRGSLSREKTPLGTVSRSARIHL